MSTDTPTIDCYICALHQHQMDPYLESQGFGRGMIIFAIPNYGVLFKCRAEGELIDLEFGAFFSLLKFFKEKLAGQKVPRLRVHSSSPEFIFTLSNKGPHLSNHPERQKVLKEHLASLTVEVTYCRRINNRALTPSDEYPMTPANQTPIIRPTPEDQDGTQFKPFQKGVRL